MVATALAVAATVAGSAPAYADEVSGSYTRSQVHAAAKWVSEHGGRVGGLGGLLGFGGSVGCGPAAVVCGGIVAYWVATGGVYTDVITTASDHNACLYLYGGDTISSSDGGLPYVHEFNDGTCRD